MSLGESEMEAGFGALRRMVWVVILAAPISLLTARAVVRGEDEERALQLAYRLQVSWEIVKAHGLPDDGVVVCQGLDLGTFNSRVVAAVHVGTFSITPDGGTEMSLMSVSDTFFAKALDAARAAGSAQFQVAVTDWGHSKASRARLSRKSLGLEEPAEVEWLRHSQSGWSLRVFCKPDDSVQAIELGQSPDASCGQGKSVLSRSIQLDAEDLVHLASVGRANQVWVEVSLGYVWSAPLVWHQKRLFESFPRPLEIASLWLLPSELEAGARAAKFLLLATPNKSEAMDAAAAWLSVQVAPRRLTEIRASTTELSRRTRKALYRLVLRESLVALNRESLGRIVHIVLDEGACAAVDHVHMSAVLESDRTAMRQGVAAAIERALPPSSRRVDGVPGGRPWMSLCVSPELDVAPEELRERVSDYQRKVLLALRAIAANDTVYAVDLERLLAEAKRLSRVGPGNRRRVDTEQLVHVALPIDGH